MFSTMQKALVPEPILSLQYLSLAEQTRTFQLAACVLYIVPASGSSKMPCLT